MVVHRARASATVSNSTVVGYADDMVLYKPIQSHAHTDYSLIQMDINGSDHLDRNSFPEVQPSKLMLFSRKGKLLLYYYSTSYNLVAQ